MFVVPVHVHHGLRRVAHVRAYAEGRALAVVGHDDRQTSNQLRRVVGACRIDTQHAVRQLHGGKCRYEQMADVADVGVHIIDGLLVLSPCRVCAEKGARQQGGSFHSKKSHNCLVLYNFISRLGSYVYSVHSFLRHSAFPCAYNQFLYKIVVYQHLICICKITEKTAILVIITP